MSCSESGSCIFDMSFQAESAIPEQDFQPIDSKEGVLHWTDGDSSIRTISVLLRPKASSQTNASFPGFITFGVRLINSTVSVGNLVASTIFPGLPSASCATKQEGRCGMSSVAFVSAIQNDSCFFRAIAPADRVLEGSTDKVSVTIQRVGGIHGNISVRYICVPAMQPFVPTGAVPGEFPQEFLPCSGLLHWEPGDSTNRVVEVGLVSDQVYVQGRYARAARLSLSIPSEGCAIDPVWNGATVLVYDDDIGKPGTLSIREGRSSFLEPGIVHFSFNESSSAALFEQNLATVCCPKPDTRIGESLTYFAPYADEFDFTFTNGLWLQPQKTVPSISEQISSSCGLAEWGKHKCQFAFSSACFEGSGPSKKVDRVTSFVWLAVENSTVLNVAPNTTGLFWSLYPTAVSQVDSYSVFPAPIAISNLQVLLGKTISIWSKFENLYFDLTFLNLGMQTLSYTRTEPFSKRTDFELITINFDQTDVVDEINDAVVLLRVENLLIDYSTALEDFGPDDSQDLTRSVMWAPVPTSQADPRSYSDFETAFLQRCNYISNQEDCSELVGVTASIWLVADTEFYDVTFTDWGITSTGASKYQYIRRRVYMKPEALRQLPDEIPITADPQTWLITVAEEAGLASLEITRQHGDDRAVFLQYSTKNSSDMDGFLPSRGVLYWEEGNFETKSIQIPFMDNKIIDPVTREFMVTFSDVLSSEVGAVPSEDFQFLHSPFRLPVLIEGNRTVVIRILDDDGPGIFSISSVDPYIEALIDEKGPHFVLQRYGEGVGTATIRVQVKLYYDTKVTPIMDFEKTWIAGDTAPKIVRVGPDYMSPASNSGNLSYLKAEILQVMVPYWPAAPIIDDVRRVWYGYLRGNKTNAGLEISLSQQSSNFLVFVLNRVNASTILLNFTCASNLLVYPSSGTIVWGPGQDRLSINVSIIQTEQSGTANNVTLSVAGSAISSTPPPVLNADCEAGLFAEKTITLLNPAGAGVFKFVGVYLSVSEADGRAVLTVGRFASSSGVASVQWATVDGTGTAGLNYIANSGELIWADGMDGNQTIEVDIIAGNADPMALSQTFRVVLIECSPDASIDSDKGQATVLTYAWGYAYNFIKGSVSESSTVYNNSNALTFSFAPTFFVNSEVLITVSGFVGVAPIHSSSISGQVPISGESAAQLGSFVTWLENSMIIIKVVPGQVLEALEEVSFGLEVVNMVDCQPARSLLISSSSPSIMPMQMEGLVLSGCTPSLKTRSVTTSLCLDMSCPASTLFKAYNFIKINLSPSRVDLEAGSQIIISGLLDSSTASTSSFIVSIQNSAGAEETSASWDQQLGVLIISSIPIPLLQSENTYIGFRLRNGVSPSRAKTTLLLQVRNTSGFNALGPTSLDGGVLECSDQELISHFNWTTPKANETNTFVLDMTFSSLVGGISTGIAVQVTGFDGFSSVSNRLDIAGPQASWVRAWPRGPAGLALWSSDCGCISFEMVPPASNRVLGPRQRISLQFTLRNPAGPIAQNAFQVIVSEATPGAAPLRGSPTLFSLVDPPRIMSALLNIGQANPLYIDFAEEGMQVFLSLSIELSFILRPFDSIVLRLHDVNVTGTNNVTWDGMVLNSTADSIAFSSTGTFLQGQLLNFSVPADLTITTTAIRYEPCASEIWVPFEVQVYRLSEDVIGPVTLQDTTSFQWTHTYLYPQYRSNNDLGAYDCNTSTCTPRYIDMATAWQGLVCPRVAVNVTLSSLAPTAETVIQVTVSVFFGTLLNASIVIGGWCGFQLGTTSLASGICFRTNFSDPLATINCSAFSEAAGTLTLSAPRLSTGSVGQVWTQLVVPLLDPAGLKLETTATASFLDHSNRTRPFRVTLPTFVAYNPPDAAPVALPAATFTTRLVQVLPLFASGRGSPPPGRIADALWVAVTVVPDRELPVGLRLTLAGLTGSWTPDSVAAAVHGGPWDAFKAHPSIASGHWHRASGTLVVRVSAPMPRRVQTTFAVKLDFPCAGGEQLSGGWNATLSARGSGVAVAPAAASVADLTGNCEAYSADATNYTCQGPSAWPGAANASAAPARFLQALIGGAALLTTGNVTVTVTLTPSRALEAGSTVTLAGLGAAGLLSRDGASLVRKWSAGATAIVAELGARVPACGGLVLSLVYAAGTALPPPAGVAAEAWVPLNATQPCSALTANCAATGFPIARVTLTQGRALLSCDDSAAAALPALWSNSSTAVTTATATAGQQSSGLVSCPAGCDRDDAWTHVPGAICAAPHAVPVPAADLAACRLACRRAPAEEMGGGGGGCAALVWREGGDPRCFLYAGSCPLVASVGGRGDGGGGEGEMGTPRDGVHLPPRNESREEVQVGPTPPCAEPPR